MSSIYSPGNSQSIFINNDGRIGIMTNAVDGVSAMTINGGVNCASLTLPNATITGNYSDLSSIPLASISNAGTTLNRVKMWMGTVTTNTAGQAVFYPTSTNTMMGTALFTSIINVNANAWANVVTANSVPNVSGKSISSDMTTITFNVTQGTNLGGFGGATTQFVGSVINVMCLVIGT